MDFGSDVGGGLVVTKKAVIGWVAGDGSVEKVDVVVVHRAEGEV